MTYKIEFYPEARLDLLNLPTSVKKEIAEFIKTFSADPYSVTQALHDRKDIKLKGCRKTYCGDAKFRIITKVIENTVKIVEIIAIGKRDDKEVYFLAAARIAAQENSK